MAGFIISGVVFLILIFLITIYNKLVKLKNIVAEGWSGIDVQLKKRYNLIPNLVETVKGYATHENEVFNEVTEKRSVGINAKTIKEQENAENMITQALGKLFAVAENYPDLKASHNFQNLQDQLSNVEEDIQMARRYYNGAVRENNIYVESFPSNMIANIFSFRSAEYFEIADDTQRAVPKVTF